MCDSSAARRFIKYIDDMFAAEDALTANVQHAKRKLFVDEIIDDPKKQRTDNSLDQKKVEPRVEEPLELKILNYTSTEPESQTSIGKESILTLSHVGDISNLNLKTFNYDSSTELDGKKSIFKESILTISHLELYKDLHEDSRWELDSNESINYNTVCHSLDEEISVIKNGSIIGFTDSCWGDEFMATLPLVKTPSSEIYLPGLCPFGPPMALSTPIKQIK